MIRSPHRYPILIPTRERPDVLAETLPHAAATGLPVIVCDQSASPSAVPGAVSMLHRPDLAGLPAARNALLAAVPEAEVVTFIDDDTTLAPDYGATLEHLATTEPTISGWGPVIETRSPFQQRLHRIAQLGAFCDPRRRVASPTNRRTSALFGCCFSVRRDALAAIGGFDARRPGYALGEDLDACWRLTNAGFRLRFSAALQAVHREALSGRPDQRQRGRAKAEFLRWWASRHAHGNPASLLHLGLALAAAASGRGREPASPLGVLAGTLSSTKAQRVIP